MADAKPSPRQVAGLWCDEVLGRLPDFVDGVLSPADVAAVRAHLADCDWCARFGGRYAATVQQLREALAAPQEVDDDVARRLRDRLARELS